MCTDVKGIISELQSYLQEYLTIDEIILDELVAKKFLPKAYADPMKSKAKQGNKQEATVDFIGYIGDFYDSKKLAKLCAYFMEKSDYMPRFEEVAKKISHELEVLEITQSDPKRRKTETPSPSYSGTSSVSVSKELSSEDKNPQEMPASFSWKMCPALPVSTKHASAAVNKDYLFVMSKANSKSSKSLRTESEGDVIYSLPLGTQKWVKMKEFPKPLKSFAVSCDDNYLYVTGGNKCAEGLLATLRGDNGGTNEVLACTSPEDEWDNSIIPEMNNARFCHGANFLNPYLIVAGGFSSDNTIEIINTAKKGQTWFEVGTLPIHMVWPYVTGSHSTVYIGLGCTENYKEPSDIIIGLPRSDLEDLATKDKHPDFENREEIPPPPLQCSALATKNTILIAIGGHVRENERKYPVQSENTCYYFCASDKKWRIMEKSSLTMKRSNPCIASDSNIYVIGGWMKLENMDKNEPSITYCSAVERGLLD